MRDSFLEYAFAILVVGFVGWLFLISYTALVGLTIVLCIVTLVYPPEKGR